MPKEMLFPQTLVQKNSASIRIVEIGPGNGSVTIPLLQQLATLSTYAIQYDAIDLDPDAIEELKNNISHNNVAPHISFTAHQRDILTFDWSTLTKTDYLWIVGSLPYNISKKIITKTPVWLGLVPMDTKVLPTRYIIQLEVAQDYVSTYPKVDFLGNWLDLFSTSHAIKATLPPGSFTPPPRVDSAILEIDWKRCTPEELGKNIAMASFIKQCYQYPRKTMKQVIKLHHWKLQENKALDIAEKRPGELAVSDYLTLYQEVFSQSQVTAK